MAFWVLCVRLRAGSKFFVKLALHNACSQVSVRLVGTGSVPKLKCRVNKPWSLAWEITIPNVLKWLMSANPYWGSTWEHLWHEIEFSSCWCTRRWQKVGLTWRRRLRLWKMISGWNKQRRGPLVATQKKYFVVSEISSVCFVVTSWHRQELLLEKEHSVVRRTIKKHEERSRKFLHRKHLSFTSHLILVSFAVS